MSKAKNPDAYIDSGATHHFFHDRNSFETYTSISQEPVIGATGISEIIGKGIIRLPIDNGIYVEAYHAPKFSSNILSVGLLQKQYDITFSECRFHFSRIG